MPDTPIIQGRAKPTYPQIFKLCFFKFMSMTSANRIALPFAIFFAVLMFLIAVAILMLVQITAQNRFEAEKQANKTAEKMRIKQ